MAGRIAILHYSSPPVVGGVELTIAHHARGLADLDYQVRCISGDGSVFDDRVDVLVEPLISSTHPDILKLKLKLDSGEVTPAFWEMVDILRTRLQLALADCSVIIVHNALTLHKNLALTAALASLNTTRSIRIIAWAHDLAWTNPQYLPEIHNTYPWDLLRKPWPGVRYVTVSDSRQHELANLFGVARETIPVVTPGLDLARWFHWTPTMCDIEARLHLLDADGLLLLPARLTRRKNIELALRILADLRSQSGADFRLLVTGPPGPHNPGNQSYLDELLVLRHELGLDDCAHLLYAYREQAGKSILDDDTLANLFQLADALLFPSTQEGFGIPLLEAAMVSIPIFCADIPAFRLTGQDDVTYFDPVADSPRNIAGQILRTLGDNRAFRMRLRVRHTYRWEILIREHLLPLLEDL